MIDDIPVVDAVVHAYNMDPSNYVSDFASVVCDLVYGTVEAFSAEGYRPPKEEYLKDWSIEETANLVFAESQTDLACHHVLPIYAFKDGLCSLDKTIEAKERWPGRFLTYAGIDPMTGEAALEELDRQIEILDPVGVKMYPNSWAGSEFAGWKMDDPEIAFPVFEHAQKRGIKVVAIHKAVPLGPVPMEHYKVDDIDRAAMAFPDLNFEIVHGGMAFVEETAWQIARFHNVYANLEITASFLGARPGAFKHALATLLEVGGDHAVSKVIWGTGAMAFHPQPMIERFVRDFEFEDELVQERGIPQVTREVKRKILGENYAAMVGFDLRDRLEMIEGDEFDVRKRDGLVAPYSSTHAAGLVH
jgi:predicted TIM-barrel fold metal-dependent hydrolase